MATIGNFEDIEAWQKARELTKAIYACSGKGAFSIDLRIHELLETIRHKRSEIQITRNQRLYHFNHKPETRDQRPCYVNL